MWVTRPFLAAFLLLVSPATGQERTSPRTLDDPVGEFIFDAGGLVIDALGELTPKKVGKVKLPSWGAAEIPLKFIEADFRANTRDIGYDVALAEIGAATAVGEKAKQQCPRGPLDFVCTIPASFIAEEQALSGYDQIREGQRLAARKQAEEYERMKDAEFRRVMANMPTTFTTTSPDRVVKTNRVTPTSVTPSVPDVAPTVFDVPIPTARPKIEETPVVREPRPSSSQQVAGGGVNLDVLSGSGNKRSSGGVDLDVLSTPSQPSGGKQGGRKKECNGLGGSNVIWCYAEMGPYSKYGNILTGVHSGQVPCGEARAYFKRALAGARSAPGSKVDKDAVRYALETQEIAVGHFCGW